MNNQEIFRFDFLVRRDGLKAALEFEARTSEIYRRAMLVALEPVKREETPTRAKGREWAEIYCNAARECDEILKRYGYPADLPFCPDR